MHNRKTGKNHLIPCRDTCIQNEDGIATLIRNELTRVSVSNHVHPAKALKLADAKISITPMTAHFVLMGKDTSRGLS